jgi:hypothetical protein
MTPADKHERLTPSGTTAASRPPSRQGKALVSGHFETTTLDAIHEHLGRIRRKTGIRVTLQDFIAAGLAMAFIATGKKPPTRELQHAIEQTFITNPPAPPARGSKPAASSTKHRTSSDDPT